MPDNHFDFTIYQQEERTAACLAFSEYVKSKLLSKSVQELPPIEQRNAEVTHYTECFFQHFGENMHTVCLYYLSNYLLLDYIKDRNVYKARDEGSFLSPNQLTKRSKCEIPVSDDFMSATRAEHLFNIAKPVLKVNQDDV